MTKKLIHATKLIFTYNKYNLKIREKIVMISEEDYRNMNETLCLLSILNMYKSIIEGRAEPIEKCSDKLE